MDGTNSTETNSGPQPDAVIAVPGPALIRWSSSSFSADPSDAVRTTHFPNSTSSEPMFVATAGIEAPSIKPKKKKTVELANGNLVLEFPVPVQVLNLADKKYREKQEFKVFRYTAATCNPDEFLSQNYTLRQKECGTEIFVVITMFNENDILFKDTMFAVMRNIAYLCSKKDHPWGPEAWKKVTVCIVADGRKKCDQRVLTVLGAMGVYQEGIAQNTVEGRETTAHIYEYTTQVMVDPKLGIRGSAHGVVPVQILFCLKEQNKKKLNSHRWFFKAFGPVLHPNICVLLDVGTKPADSSIYHLSEAFRQDRRIAGACGEIVAAKLGSGWWKNILVAAQNFEYKMSNILDKPFESVMGYVSVLPGAFSAYRYEALQDYETDEGPQGPLSSYFKGETNEGDAKNLFEANMYLAEDRILCFELVAKPHCSWLLKYVKEAKAETDVPDAVPEFVSQRRRWLNGSLFAAIHALVNMTQIRRTTHSHWRKFLLLIEFVYNALSLLFGWFSLGNLYLTFYLLTLSADTDDGTGPFGRAVLILPFMRYTYFFSLVIIFICALGNRPQASKLVYTLCMALFAVMMGLMFYMAVFTMAHRTLVLGDIVIPLISTFGFYFLASFLHRDPRHMVTSFGQYMFLLPSFVNILMVYSFCNTHDVSWGTKGDNGPMTDLGAAVAVPRNENHESGKVELTLPEEDLGNLNIMYDLLVTELTSGPVEKPESRDAKPNLDDYYKMFRTRLVLFWVFSNCVLIWVVVGVSDKPSAESPSVGYLAFILWSVAFLSSVRFLGSVAYLWCSEKPLPHRPPV